MFETILKIFCIQIKHTLVTFSLKTKQTNVHFCFFVAYNFITLFHKNNLENVKHFYLIHCRKKQFENLFIHLNAHVLGLKNKFSELKLNKIIK